MSTIITVPIAPGTLLSSASAELQKQIAALVPAGKKGAAMTIVDSEGITIGLAASHRGIVTISLDVHQSWKKQAPTASLKVKASW